MHSRELLKTNLLKQESVLLIEIDDAQYVTERFPKFLSLMYIQLHGMNTAGLSALSLIERLVAPVFYGLVGIILPHDHFSNHLATPEIILEEQ